MEVVEERLFNTLILINTILNYLIHFVYKSGSSVADLEKGRDVVDDSKAPLLSNREPKKRSNRIEVTPEFERAAWQVSSSSYSSCFLTLFFCFLQSPSNEITFIHILTHIHIS